MKVALVHEWLVSQRGGENVLDAFCELFPEADLFTLIHIPGTVTPRIEARKIHTSFLQKIPGHEKRYRHFLPFMPTAIESFDLSKYDFILSSSHCVAKGVKKNSSAFHVSYVHAPMRYMWDRFDDYFGPGRYDPVTRLGAKIFRSYLQRWDRLSAKRCDVLFSNSDFIGAKIKQFYGLESKTVHPFCDTEYFKAPRDPKDFYLIVTALVPYKRIDLAIDAFKENGKKLIIVGEGPELEKLKQMAEGLAHISFQGGLKKQDLAKLYSQAKALVFPGVEDFGIVPVEALAAGCPVIAYGQGGLTETVTNETGIFFNEQTTSALNSAIFKLEDGKILEENCRKRGQQFSRPHFFKKFVQGLKQNVPAKTWSSLLQHHSALKSYSD